MADPQPSADRDLVRYLDRLAEESDLRRDETGVKDADLNIRFQRGQQWPESSPAGIGRRAESNQYRFVLNLVNMMMKRKAAMITDARPQVDVASRASRKWTQTANAFKQCAMYVWDEEKLDVQGPREIMRAGVIGCTCAVPVWDPSANYGRGAIRIRFYDPRQISFDPSVTASSRLNEAEYFQTRDVVPTNWIREAYPTKGGAVKPSTRWSEYDAPKQNRRGTASGTILSALARPWKRDKNETVESATPRNEIRHSWFKDFERDKEGDPVWTRPRHLRHVVDADGVILMDEKMPYLHQAIPGHLFDWDIELEHAWGTSEVGGLRRIQYTLNRIIGLMMDNVLLTNKTRVVADTDAVDAKAWDLITQNPNGMYVRKRTGRTFDYKTPEGAIPPHMFQVVTLLMQAVDMASGLFEASQGKKTGGVISGVALEGLQIAAQSIVRLEARAFEDWIERIFQQVISLIWQYFTSDQVFAILGPGQRFTEFEFNRDEFIKDDGGNPLPEDAWQDFAFRVLPGSSLQSTRMQRGIMALNLHKAGIVPGVDVLRATEYPDPEETLKAAMEEQAARAAMMPQQDQRKHKKDNNMIPLPGQARRTAQP